MENSNLPLAWHEYFAVLETVHSCMVPHPLKSMKVFTMYNKTCDKIMLISL